MPSATVAADLAADAAARADVVAASLARQAAALRAYHADDPTLLAHVESFAGGMEKHAKNLNKPGPGGATPLLVACVQGNAAVAEALLEAGADPAAEGDVWDLGEVDDVNEEDEEKYKYLDLFGQVFDRVRSSYVEEVTDQELIEKAIDGMLSGLDPHSGFMNEEVFQEMQMDTEGKFGGLGIEITMEEGFVKVIAPIEDTPAYEAGVLAGDYIIQIDETPVFGLTLNEAVELMRGKKGEPIVITISRANTEPFEIEIIRDYIKIRSVKSEVLNNIGYLRITSFNEQTESGLLDAIKKIEKENQIKGYVLDVRSNPGGLLTQAVKVTDIFLERGEIVSTRGRDKKDIRRYRAKKSDRTNGKPLVVIIDGGSASASEIVAGALQDHKRAIIIGTQSFGKGSVQTIIPFQVSNSDNLTGIRLTTARYYTPSGESIQGKGIVPDILIE